MSDLGKLGVGMARVLINLAATIGLVAVWHAASATTIPGRDLGCTVGTCDAHVTTTFGGKLLRFAESEQERQHDAIRAAADLLCSETGDKSPLEQRAQQCTIVVDFAREHKILYSLAEALTNRCWAHIMLKEVELANPDCAGALEAEQENERHGEDATRFAHAVYAAKAVLQSLLGNDKGALEDDNTAIDYITSPDPGYAYIFTNRGLTYVDLGQFDSALDDYNQAIRLDRKYMPGYLARGLEYERRGDTRHAQEDFEKALALPAEEYDLGHEKHAKAEAHLKALSGK
jgi:tetratricopeptide (TPR) repeat protein